MPRIMSMLFLALLPAVAGASGAAAQASGCQPTLTQPCPKPQTRPNNDQSPQRSPATKTDDEPIDRSKRLKVDKDTDLNWGFGGIGLGRKF
jgi:hypothetical protein